jgi:hypothetical protein
MDKISKWIDTVDANNVCGLQYLWFLVFMVTVLDMAMHATMINSCTLYKLQIYKLGFCMRIDTISRLRLHHFLWKFVSSTRQLFLIKYIPRYFTVYNYRFYWDDDHN